MKNSSTKHLDKYETIDAVYTDFEKVFDKVSHKRLIFKLKKYGISQHTLTQITEYLIIESLELRLRIIIQCERM